MAKIIKLLKNFCIKYIIKENYAKFYGWKIVELNEGVNYERNKQMSRLDQKS